MRVISDLIAAENAREEMLDSLTRALVHLDNMSGRTKVAVKKARDVAYVDGDGGPLPKLIALAVYCASELDSAA